MTSETPLDQHRPHAALEEFRLHGKRGCRGLIRRLRVLAPSRHRPTGESCHDEPQEQRLLDVHESPL
jgi:hypothetical protein